LQCEIGSLGSVTLDPQVARCTGLAIPVMLDAPECPAARSIEAIAATLASTRINSVRTAA
jgi:MinD-like ATPase involved in chromosome partitioning or flagellar assembly